jgi:hypothetical protein
MTLSIKTGLRNRFTTFSPLMTPLKSAFDEAPMAGPGCRVSGFRLSGNKQLETFGFPLFTPISASMSRNISVNNDSMKYDRPVKT